MSKDKKKDIIRCITSQEFYYTSSFAETLTWKHNPVKQYTNESQEHMNVGIKT